MKQPKPNTEIVWCSQCMRSKDIDRRDPWPICDYCEAPMYDLSQLGEVIGRGLAAKGAKR